MGTEINGLTRFYIDTKITSQEMSEWAPARISMFFRGIAEAIKAAGDSGMVEVHVSLPENPLLSKSPKKA